MNKKNWFFKNPKWQEVDQLAIYKANSQEIGHFTVVYLVAKHLICSEVEGDLVVIETS